MHQGDEDCRKISSKYNKQEFFGMIFVLTGELIMFTAVVVIAPELGVNDSYLPINFQFDLFPIVVNWILNWLFQVFSISCAAVVYSPFILMILLLIDHTCWAIDILMALLGKLDTVDGPSASSTDNELIKKRQEIIYKTHLKTLEWMDEVQEVIKFYYLAEYSIYSLLVCLCIYTIDDNLLSVSYTNQLLVALLFQLFVSSLMGTRVIIKIEDLRAAMYNVEWYNYNADNMKTIRIMLQTSQNMQEYHGIFKKVTMSTFQEVSEKFWNDLKIK
jgi:hypothetical protein